MSFWGFSISSLALVCSSKPIHWKTINPMTPMITTKSVGKNPPSPPWKPPLSPAITTRTAKKEEREPDDGAQVGHPLHVAQREDVHGHGPPYEQEADERLPALLAVQLAAPQSVKGGDRGRG